MNSFTAGSYRFDVTASRNAMLQSTNLCLFHPDCDRWSRILTESAPPARLRSRADLQGSRTCAVVFGERAYRQWGFPPRPETEFTARIVSVTHAWRKERTSQEHGELIFRPSSPGCGISPRRGFRLWARACPQARADGAAFLDDFASIAHACPKVLLRVVLMCRFGVSPKRIGRNGKLSTVYQFGTGLAQFRSRGIALGPFTTKRCVSCTKTSLEFCSLSRTSPTVLPRWAPPSRAITPMRRARKV